MSCAWPALWNSPIGISMTPNADNDLRTSHLGTAAAMLFLALNADELARRQPRCTDAAAKCCPEARRPKQARGPRRHGAS